MHDYEPLLLIVLGFFGPIFILWALLKVLPELEPDE